ncbi:MAG: hypothetical protein IPN46_06305 [Saprospiraceae bacterium]|nr:hypothetical protein [Saprospiraceae bacterium]
MTTRINNLLFSFSPFLCMAQEVVVDSVTLRKKKAGGATEPDAHHRKVKDDKIMFDHLEFNFIQYVKFFGRAKIYKKYRKEN